jgi:hypothetical protein
MKELRLSLRTLTPEDVVHVRELADILRSAVCTYRTTHFRTGGGQTLFACADLFLMVANELANEERLSAEEASFLISQVKFVLRRHTYRYDFNANQRKVLRSVGGHPEGTGVAVIVKETALTHGVVEMVLIQMRQKEVVGMERPDKGGSAGIYRITDTYIYEMLGLPTPPATELVLSGTHATMPHTNR